MRHIVRYGFLAACIMAGVLLVAGCGGDDDKGTGPSTLSTEAQFDSLSTHLNFEPGTGDDDIVSTMLAQLNAQYWDGVDQSDFDFSVGGRFESKFFPHVSPAAISDTSLSFSYDIVGGWWYIEYRESWISDFLSVSYEAVFTDSVRFETATGTAQMVPDEVSTYRIIQHASIELTALSTSESDSVGVATDFRTEATGLNSATVTVNGDGMLALGFSAAREQTSVDMSVLMLANWDDVTVSNPGASDVCPLSGNITGDFTLDLDVHDGINHYEANGGWGVGIDFTGNGNTTVNVHTGDFQREFSGNVCTE